MSASIRGVKRPLPPSLEPQPRMGTVHLRCGACGDALRPFYDRTMGGWLVITEDGDVVGVQPGHAARCTNKACGAAIDNRIPTEATAELALGSGL